MAHSNQPGNQVPHQDIRVAAAALMIKVIEADGVVDNLELANMIEILRTQFVMTNDEIRVMIERARQTSNQEKSLEALATTLCSDWGLAERKRLLDDFWLIATADNDIDIGEQAVIESIAAGLKLNSKDILEAHAKAEQVLELKGP
jgi:uncharacterized tellurite resistance protein B-like protein